MLRYGCVHVEALAKKIPWCFERHFLSFGLDFAEWVVGELARA
jgi:hypothetical protein